MATEGLEKKQESCVRGVDQCCVGKWIWSNSWGRGKIKTMPLSAILNIMEEARKIRRDVARKAVWGET